MLRVIAVLLRQLGRRRGFLGRRRGRGRGLSTLGGTRDGGEGGVVGRAQRQRQRVGVGVGHDGNGRASMGILSVSWLGRVTGDGAWIAARPGLQGAVNPLEAGGAAA